MQALQGWGSEEAQRLMGRLLLLLAAQHALPHLRQTQPLRRPLHRPLALLRALPRGCAPLAPPLLQCWALARVQPPSSHLAQQAHAHG